MMPLLISSLSLQTLQASRDHDTKNGITQHETTQANVTSAAVPGPYKDEHNVLTHEHRV